MSNNSGKTLHLNQNQNRQNNKSGQQNRQNQNNKSGQQNRQNQNGKSGQQNRQNKQPQQTKANQSSAPVDVKTSVSTPVESQVETSTESLVESQVETTESQVETEAPAISFSPVSDLKSIDSLVGRFVKDKNAAFKDVHYVTYVSGDGSWVYASGLGKRGEYPLLVSDITEVSEKVELAASKLFIKKFTYLTDDNNLYRVLRGEDGNLQLQVAADSKVVRSWFNLQSIVYLHHVPVAVRHSDERANDIVILAESDDQLNDSQLDVLRNNSKVAVRTMPSSDIETVSEDFAAGDFQICYC